MSRAALDRQLHDVLTMYLEQCSSLDKHKQLVRMCARTMCALDREGMWRACPVVRRRHWEARHRVQQQEALLRAIALGSTARGRVTILSLQHAHLSACLTPLVHPVCVISVAAISVSGPP